MFMELMCRSCLVDVGGSWVVLVSVGWVFGCCLVDIGWIVSVVGLGVMVQGVVG